MEHKNESCPCKRINCERHGDCDACRAHHNASARKLPPACEKKRRSCSEEKRRTRNG